MLYLLLAPVVAVVVFLVIRRNPKTVAKIEADATVVAKAASDVSKQL